jgi:hypothetical protein
MTKKVTLYTIGYPCGCDYTFKNTNDLHIDIQVVDHWNCEHHSANVMDNLGIT